MIIGLSIGEFAVCLIVSFVFGYFMGRKAN